MTSAHQIKLKAPPIVEAVLDIDCDMPLGFDLAALNNPIRDAFRDRYPKCRTQFIQAVQFEATPDRAPSVTTKQGVQALQLLQEDEKQLPKFGGPSWSRVAVGARCRDS